VGVVSALMLATMGRAVALLTLALGASYLIWLTRADWQNNRGILPIFLIAIAVQTAHLTEEIWSRFYREFPPVLGAAPWSERQFVIFNLLWLALFVLTAVGVARQWRPAYVGTLFLGIGGGVGNGLGHLALTIRANGYFSGAYTAPIVLLVALLLLARHRRPVGRGAPAV
jgi:hypothetical protein